MLLFPAPNRPSPNIYSFSHNLDHSSKINEEKKPSVLSSALASYPKAYNNVSSAPLLPPPGFQVRQFNHDGGMNDCLQQSNCHLAESNEMYPRSHILCYKIWLKTIVVNQIRIILSANLVTKHSSYKD